MTGHIAPVTALAFGQVGDLPLLASVAGAVKLWNPTDGSLLWTLPTKGVTGAVFAEFGGRTALATVGSTGVELWDPVQRGRLLVFDPDPARYIGACSKQGSTTLAVADYRNVVIFRSTA